MTPYDPTHLAYFAGIMDGEGTVIHGAGSKRLTGLRVAMTDECVITWLKGTFGGTVSERTSSSGRQVYEWTLQGQDFLLELLPRVIPFALCKRRQMEAMITLIHHLKTMPRGYVKVSQRGERRKERLRWQLRAQELREAIRDAR